MRMTLVTYRKTFNLGSYTSESIGVEMELNEGDNATEALDNCATLVEEYHQKTLASLEEYRGTHVRTIGQPNPIDITIQGIIEDLNKCTEVYEKNGLGVQTGLVAYEEAAAKFPEIKAAYDLKMLQLTK